MTVEKDLIEEARRLAYENEEQYSQKKTAKLLKINTLLLIDSLERQQAPGWFRRNGWNSLMAIIALFSAIAAFFKSSS